MNKHIGSTLDSFLEEEGIRDEVDEYVSNLLEAKRTIAVFVKEGMRRRKVTKLRLARMMGTSRSVVYRLLDPQDCSVTLDTLVRAAAALNIHFVVPGGRQTRRKVSRAKSAVAALTVRR